MLWASKSLGLLATGTLLASLISAAEAVSAYGPPKRIDVDPGTAWYGFGSLSVQAIPGSRFAIAWEENNVEDQPTFPRMEAVKFRVFTKDLVAVTAPVSADTTGDQNPNLRKLVRLGPGSFYLTFIVHRKPTPQTNLTEFYGQTIPRTASSPGPRRRLNNTANQGSVIGNSAGLADGRAIFAWFDGTQSSSNPARIPARFISATGVPQAVTLDLALPQDGWAMRDIQSLGTGFVMLYSHFDSTVPRGRVFKSDGAPLGLPANLPAGALLTPLSDGRILVTRTISGPNYKLVGQIYTNRWVKAGLERTLIQGANDNLSNAVTFAALPDGGFLIGRTYNAGSDYFHSIKRFDKNLVAVGSTYVFASNGFDSAFKVANLDATKSVTVFRQRVGGRLRLVAQRLLH